jgi:hypothetical protein
MIQKEKKDNRISEPAFLAVEKQGVPEARTESLEENKL